MTRATVLLTALLTAFSVGAVAQTTTTDTGTGTGTDSTMGTGTGTGTTGGASGLSFDNLDANRDGILEEDELEDATDFDQMDQDGNDEVDRQEFMQYQSQQGR